MDHAIVMRMARQIQWIEHGGRHTWESCMPEARARALLQAMACFEEMRLSAIVDAYEQLPGDIASDPAMEVLGGLIARLRHELESV